MATDEIKPGDVVTLKSGSPRMTVATVIKSGDVEDNTYSEDELPCCECKWHDDSGFQSAEFLLVVLEKVPPES